MNYREFLSAFGNKSGYDFSDYSCNSIARRLTLICAKTGLSFEEILNRVVRDKEFVRQVVEGITVNTTELFRDPAVWVSLGQTLYKKLPRGVMTTLWHVGCSTGLEPYSDLIMLEELGLAAKSRVYGTDINPTVLEVARKGQYNYGFNKGYVSNFEAVMKGLGLPARFEKYFDIDERADTMTVKPFLRERVQYLRQDLVKDKAPFAYRVDVVFFRNVMIYFNEELQVRILRDVCDRMHPGAALVMGKQEDIPGDLRPQFTRTGEFYRRNS